MHVCIANCETWYYYDRSIQSGRNIKYKMMTDGGTWALNIDVNVIFPFFIFKYL